MCPDVPEVPRTFALTRRMRLCHAREFQAVHQERLRKSRGSLVVAGRANALGHSRLGLAIGKRVGNAVTRNRVKRQIREAFRLARPDIDAFGLDLVVSLRSHGEMNIRENQKYLTESAQGVAREVARRNRRSERMA